MNNKPAFPSDAADKVLVRMPDGMRDQLKSAAKANNRTMNAEIVSRLEDSFSGMRPQGIAEFERMKSEILQELRSYIKQARGAPK